MADRVDIRWRSRRRWLIVAAVAIGWWGLLWVQVDRTVLTRVPVLDEAYYLETAADIAEGEYLPGEPFVLSPLYPYLVALTGSGRHLDAVGVRAGLPPLGIRCLQVLGWLLIVFLLYRIAGSLLARRGNPRWPAFIPPALFVLYRPATVFATTSLLEIPLTVVVVVFLYLMTRPLLERTNTDPEPSYRPPATTASGADGRRADHVVAAGILVGLATLLRGHALALLVPGWLACGLVGGTAGRRLRRMLVLTAVTLAVIAPVVLYNSWQAGRPAGVSQNGGLNFYIGSGPQARGFFTTFVGFDFEGDPAGVEFLSRRLGRPVTGPGEADRIWLAETWRSVREQPGRALTLWAKKVWLHVQSWEIAQLTPLDAWPREAPQLHLLFVPYGLISGFGLAGLVLVGWRRRALWPWLAALSVLVASQSIFFVVSRYRLVIVPVLCLLAGLAVAYLLAARGRRRLLAILVTIVCLAAAWPWGMGDVRVVWQAMARENEAVRWERVGDAASLARAESLYREAIEFAPSRPPAYRGLGRIYLQTERPEQAERILGRGILHVPATEQLERELIAVLLGQQRIDDALTRIQSFLRDFGDDPQMLHNFSVALAQTGRLPAAIDAARRLLAVSPNHPQSYIDLGVLLARSGRTAAAAEILATGLERFPDNTDLQHNLGLLADR